MTDRPAEPAFRIQTLDVIRGLAVLGILAVNAVAFGLPLCAELVPEQIPFADAPGAGLAQWVTDVFFAQKFVTLFSMLFGVSIFLVGGEKGDPLKSPQLKRRLLWLLAIGLIHGIVFWYGDILMLYAVVGLIMGLMRSWTAKRLILIGASITLLLGLAQGASNILTPDQSEPLGFFDADALEKSIAAYQSGWPAGFIENLKAWGIGQGLSLIVYLVPTLTLMMLGLGLFKSGFFHGRLPPKLYAGLMVAGALTLTMAGTLQAYELGLIGPQVSTHGWASAALSFPVIISLGYASLLVWLTPRLPCLRKLLAPVGQMAFTNYLTQTLIMTTLFSLPWGPRLMGQVDYVGMWGLVLLIWALQLVWSPLWLKHFRMGPFEWAWRCLTYNQRLPLRRV